MNKLLIVGIAALAVAIVHSEGRTQNPCGPGSYYAAPQMIVPDMPVPGSGGSIFPGPPEAGQSIDGVIRRY